MYIFGRNKEINVKQQKIYKISRKIKINRKSLWTTVVSNCILPSGDILYFSII